MKIKLIGNHLEDILPIIEELNFEIVDSCPDVVVTLGGDGAMLGAEHDFPGIPKYPLRDHRSAPLCPRHSYRERLEDLAAGKYVGTELIKLAGACGGHRVVGINDVFIHNVNRVSALRYQVKIDEELYAREIVGDGVGVSTIHGSTAYYRSITHSIFRVGIGLAFSNSTELINHLVLPEESTIKVRIIRGPALLMADNRNDQIVLNENDEVTIRKVPEKAIVLSLDAFMCEECRKLRHTKK